MKSFLQDFFFFFQVLNSILVVWSCFRIKDDIYFYFIFTVIITFDKKSFLQNAKSAGGNPFEMLFLSACLVFSWQLGTWLSGTLLWLQLLFCFAFCLVVAFSSDPLIVLLT